MNEQRKNVIVGTMTPRKMGEWKIEKKRALVPRRFMYLCAGVFCLSIGTYAIVFHGSQSENVMSHMTSGFEYDETIGRLQYVSNILPESAMVFLSSSKDEFSFVQPAQGSVIHAWSQNEPWIEYSTHGEIRASSQGDVMTIVKNRNGEYTVRLMHDGGYETIYSGLSDVSIKESEFITEGTVIGRCNNGTAFELRKDGISVLPVFSQTQSGDLQ